MVTEAGTYRADPVSVLARLAQGALLLAIALVPAYRYVRLPWVFDTPSLVGVLAIAGVLGIAAGCSGFRSPVVGLVVLIGGILLAWPPAGEALLGPAAAGGVAATGQDGQRVCLACDELLRQIGGSRSLLVAGTVIAVAAALPLATWRRPPARAAAGDPIRVTLMTRRIALGAMLGGPLVGLIGWLGFAPGDIYGAPLGAGILVGLFGLLAYVGHAAFYGLVRRATPAAVLAFAYAAAVLLVPVVRHAPAPG